PPPSLVGGGAVLRPRGDRRRGRPRLPRRQPGGGGWAHQPGHIPLVLDADADEPATTGRPAALFHFLKTDSTARAKETTMNTSAVGLDPAAALTLSVVALAVALVLVLYVARRGRGGAYMGALVAVALGLPLAATLITLWAFLSGGGAAATAIGIGATLAVWPLAAVLLRPFTAPDAVNAAEF